MSEIPKIKTSLPPQPPNEEGVLRIAAENVIKIPKDVGSVQSVHTASLHPPQAPNPYGARHEADDSLKTVCAGELLEEPDTDVPWLVQNFLAQGEVAILSGQPRSLKSSLATYISVAIATGTKTVFGPARQGTVIYFDEEGGRSQGSKRLKRFARCLNSEQTPALAKNLHFLFFSGIKFTKADFPKIFKLIELHRPVLLVVDTLRRVFPPKEDENSSGAVAQMFSEVINPLKEMGCAILLLHHNNKQSGNGMNNIRGSGDIPASVDTVWLVARHGTSPRCKLINEKMRCAQESDTLEIRMRDFNGGTIVELDLETKKISLKDDERCCIELQKQIELDDRKGGAIITTDEIIQFGESLGFGERTVERAIKLMTERGNFKKMGKGKYQFQIAESLNMSRPI